MIRNERKTLTSRRLFAGAASLAFMLFASCEIGLGKAVDTLPPEVSVTSPYTNSIIRGEFLLSGECSDDKGIEKITVSLKNTDLDETYETIKVIPDGKKWEVKLNAFDEATKKYQFNDGKYDITIQAYDTSNKTSGPRNLSVVLDNTPPLLILTRPSASDTYGQKFDLSGQVADDSNIDLLEVYVYSCADDTLLNKIELKNVPPTVDLTAAVYGDGIYETLYTGDKYSGTQEFYCEFKVYDAARKFPKEEGDNGNVAEYFYSYKNISSLMNKYRLTEIHHMQNGLKEADVSVLEKLAIPAGAEGSIRSASSKFTLNPLNNPKYSILGYAPVSKYEALKSGNEYKIANGSQVTLKISSGLDNTLIENDTIGVKAYKVQAKGENDWEPVLEKDGTVKKITVFPALKEMSGGNLEQVLTDEEAIKTREAAITEIGSYDRTIMLDINSEIGLEIGGTYIFEVTAYDQNFNNVYNEGDEYGFFLSSTGVPPSLTLDQPNEQTTYINAEGKIVIAGNTYHEEGVPSLTIKISQYGTDYVKTIELKENNGVSASGDFYLELNPADFIPEEDLARSEQYDFRITSAQGSYETSPILKTVMYDIKGPEISITSVTPLADTTIADAENGKEYFVNGEILITGSFNDEDTAVDSTSMGYKFFNAQTGKEEFRNITKQLNFKEKFDTVSLVQDKADLNIVFVAKDKAGNITEVPLYYDETAQVKYIVDQSTDYPIIAPVGFTASDDEPGRGFNTTTQGSRLSGTIADDDGLKSITIDCILRATNESASGYPVTVPFNGKNQTQYSLSQNLPSVNGTYKLSISATDINNIVSSWNALIRVQGNAPELDGISTDRNIITTTGSGVKTFTISGSISGEHSIENPLTISVSEDEENWYQIWNGKDEDYKNAEVQLWEYTVTSESGIISSEEGNHKLYIRALDTNGIPSSVKNIIYTTDNTLPEVETIKLSENDKGFIVSSPSAIEIKTKDNTGVIEYYYQVTDSAPAAVATYDELTADDSAWVLGAGNKFFETFNKEGSTGIYVYAVDKAYNLSVLKSAATKVDLNGPEVSITNSVAQVKDKFSLYGTVTDTYPSEHVSDSVAKIIIKETNQADAKEIAVSADGAWNSNEVKFPTADSDGVYIYTVSAVDAAGNPSNNATYTVTYDRTEPEPSVLVGTKLVYDGKTNAVNQTVKITGTVIETDLKSSVLKVYKGSSTTPLYTINVVTGENADDPSVEVPFTVNAKSGKSNYNFILDMDTTKVEDDEEYKFVLEAEDGAGNKKSSEDVIFVDQDSDIPEIVFTNTNINTNVNTIAGVNKDKNGENLFGVKEALKITASDDDGISSVTIYSAPAEFTGTGVSKTLNPAPADNSSKWVSGLVQNGSYILPETEGFYWIKAEVKDINTGADQKSKKVDPFLVAAYDGEPTVNVTTKTVAYVNGTDESSAKEVNVSVTYAGGSTTRIKRTVSGEGITDKSVELNTPSAKSFIDTIKVFGSENSSSVVTVTYTVENDFGQTNSVSYLYLLDNIRPVMKEGSAIQLFYYTDTVTGADVYSNYEPNKWHNEAKIKLKGTWTDEGYSTSTGEIRNGAGIDVIEYWITETSDNPGDNAINPTGSVILDKPTGDDRGFAQSISGFNEGTNYIHFRASDAAGNNSDWVSCNLNVDTTAPELELDLPAEVFTNEEGIPEFVISGTLKDSEPEAATGEKKCSGPSTYQAIRVFVGTVPASGLYDNYKKYGVSEEPEYFDHYTTVNGDKVYIFKNEIAHSATVGDDGKFSLKIGDGTGIYLPKENGKYLSSYSITVIGEDYKEHRTKKTFTLGIDTKAPGIEIKGPKNRKVSNSLGIDENPVGIYGTANDETGGSGTKAVYYQVLDANSAAPGKGTGNWTSVETTGSWSDSVTGTANGISEAGKLKEGLYKLYVYSEDNAGNTSDIISEEFHVDYSAPAVTISLDGNEFVYTENTNLPQEVRTQTFNFSYDGSDSFGLSAENGKSLVIKKDSVVIAASDDGNYSEDGTYEFTVTATDKVGKITKVSSTVKLDTTGPAVTIATPSVGEDAWQMNTQIKVSGSVQDASSVSAVWYKAGEGVSKPALTAGKTYKDDSVWAGWVKISPAGGEWTYTVEDPASSETPKARINPTFADGTTILNFAAVDEYGNVSELFGNILNIDSDAPTLKVTTDGTNEVSSVVKNTAITLEMLPADAHLASVSIKGTDIDGTKAIVPEAGKYTFKVPQVEKKYDYEILVRDKAGREISKSVSVIYDVTAPEVSVSYITTETKGTTKTAFPSDWTNNNKMTLIPTLSNTRLSGIASAGYFVSWDAYNEVQLAALDENVWNAIGLTGAEISEKDIQLSDGSGQKVYVRVKDNAGNIGYKISENTYKIDTTSPSGFITSPSTGSTIGKNQNVNVKVSAADQNNLSGLKEVKVNVLYKKVENGKEENKTEVIAAGLLGEDYIAEIPSSVLKEIGELKKADGTTILNGTIKIEAVITDKAGNDSSTSQISVNYDNDAPEVTIVNPAKKLSAETEVSTPLNGTVTFSGTSKDHSSTISSVILYRTPNTAKGETGEDVVITNVGTERKEKLVALSGTDVTAEFSDSAAYAWAYSCTEEGVEKEFVTTNLPADGEYILYAVATDSAGNKGYAARKVNVDQDTDRPEIKVSNFSLTGMGTSIENAKWHKYESFRGTVSDDDGIRYMKVSVDGGATWSEDIYDGGSWAYDVSDGPHSLMFKIEDADGTTFISSASAVAGAPKITDGSTTLGLKTAVAAAEKNTVLYAKVDTKTPDFTGMVYGDNKTANETIYYRTDNPLNASDELDTNVDGSGSKWKRGSDLSGKEFGGPGSKLYILAAAKDANGIKEITAKLGDTTVVPGTQIWTDDKDGTEGNPKAVVIELDTSAATNLTGLTKLTVEAKDQADSTKKFDATISLDNAAPVLKVLSHSNGAQAYGSLETKISGTTDKAEHVYFAVSKTESGTKTAWTEITGSNYSSGLTWNIAFNGGAVYSNAFYTKVLNGYLRDAGYDMDGATKDDMKDLYLWFYAKDALGNTSTPVSLLLKVDPSGDRPIVEITYPSKPDDEGNLATVGGIVRITGSTEVKAAGVNVQKVVLQIDPSYDEAAGFNEAGWKAELEALNGTKSVGYEIVQWTNPEKGTTSYGIVAAGSVSSWNLSINKAKELDTSNGNRKLAVRVYAMTAGKISEPVVIPFEIDANSPKIGSSKDLFLVQYDASGNVTAKRKYEENMWISGIWYLTGSVEDDSGISDITLDGTSILNTANVVKDNSSEHTLSEEGNANTYYDYSLNIPVGDATEGAYGKKEYAIVATEGSSQGLYASVNIVVNYDNKDPEFNVSSMQSTGTEIKNTNYGYTMEGSFAETGNGISNQSGFSRIAFYLTRTTGGNTYLIDPMREKGSSGTANRENITSEGYEIEQGLYWKEYSVSSVSGSKLTVSGTLSDSYRKGGLVMVKKVIYLITDVSGNDITVDGTLPDDLTASDKAYFTIAQVIDNTQQETGTKGSTLETSDNGLCSWEDGDGMIEGVILSSGTYSWNAEINSNNIWDGDVTVHFVAYDAAGNFKSVDCSGTVINNAPRMVGFRYGTDDNGNGKIQGKELRNNLSALNEEGEINKELEADGRTRMFPEYRGDSYGTKGTAERPLFTIKGITEVKPEVVGGNGVLKYSYNVTKSGDATASRTVSSTAFADYTAQDADKYNQDYVDGVISIGLRDFLETDNEIKDGINNFQFSIEDSTETGAQSCSFGFWANVIIRDTEKPHGKIKPFFWTSREENSLYKNSTAQGHIELESDWEDSDGYTSATTGIGDKDPKVSGKIVMTGTAEDNTLLEGLWFYVKGFTFTGSPESKTIDALSYSKLASYDTTSGSWTCAKEESDFTDTTSPSNYYLEITDNTIDEDSGKHSVEWKLVIDTEKLGTVAAHDVVCRLAVTDRGQLSLDGEKTKYTPNTESSTATVNTTDDAKTMYYRMDVVPYVTEIKTNLSNMDDKNKTVYSRSALGYYPVAVNEVVTIEGFNFGESPAVYIGSVEIEDTSVSDGAITNVNIGTNSSNAVKVVTSSVETINNVNSKAEYNFIPNGKSNDLLDDNVSLKVWEFKNIAEPVAVERIMYPTVKMSPKDGRIGASFANSYYFHMAGYRNNSTDWQSHAPFLCGYDGSDANSFTFDKNGYTYGGVQYRASDLPSEGGAFNFVFSTAKPENNMSLADVYRCNTGSARLEANCTNLRADPTTTKTEWAYNKWRVKSPQFVAVADDDTGLTTVYTAYYDSTTKQIRYRKGVVDAAGLVTKNIGFGGHDDGDRTAIGDAYMMQGENDSLKDVWHVEGENRYEEKEVTNVIYYEWYNPNTNPQYYYSVHREPSTWGTSADQLKLYTDKELTALVGSNIMIDMQNNQMRLRDANNSWQEIGYFDISNIKSETTVETVLVSSSGQKTTGGYWDSVKAYPGFTADIDQGPAYDSNPDSNKGYGKRHVNGPDSLQTINNQIIHVLGSSGLTGNVQDVYKKEHYSNGAGEYVALGVLSDGKAVIAWYDDNAKELLVAKEPDFTGDALKPNVGAAFANSYARTDAWENATINLGKGGEYVQLAVDSDNNIHIAYYNSSTGGELKYAKLDSSMNIIEQITVDSVDDVGSYLTINVGKDSNNNQVPYIGYFGRKHAKMAYRVQFGTDTENSLDEDGLFTQNWEVSYVPTADSIDSSAENKVNIAMWTKADGTLAKSPAAITGFTAGTTAFDGNKTKAGDTVPSGRVLANGSNNPVVAYINGSGALECAQIKGNTAEIKVE